MNSYYFDFLRQLDQFIDKYYKNTILKGFLWSLFGITTLYIVFSVLEYFFYFSTAFRLILLIAFIFFSLLLLFYFVLIPCLKLFGIKKRISYKEAVKMLAVFLPESEDKMLNILDLYSKSENIEMGEESSLDLLRAAIDQKVLSFRAYRFVNVIKIKLTWKYLKYLAFPLLILFFLLVFYPQTVVKSGNRILHFSQHFDREYPFHIQILNSKLIGLYQEDFTLRIELSGEKIPQEVFILMEGQQRKFKKEDLTHFSYIFKSLMRNVNFKIKADNYISKEYTLALAPKPILRSLRMKINYPSYISSQAVWVDAVGNTSVPEGSKIEWIIDVENSDSLIFSFSENAKKFTLAAVQKQTNKGDSRFIFRKNIREAISYSLSAYHPQALSLDTVSYQIDIIPDAYPSIQVLTFEDSLAETKRFFRLGISDDYACKYLVFVANVYDKNNVLQSQFLDSLDILPNRELQEVSYFFDVQKYNLQAGQRLEYFFWVYDNDVYHGYKKTASSSFSFYKKSQEELLKEVQKQSEQLDKSMQKSISKVSSMKNDLDKMSKQLTEKSNLSWEDKKAFEQLLKEQKALFDELKNFTNQIESKFEKEKQLSEIDPEILQKQKELEELFKELFDENMQEQLRELEEMLKENVSRETLTEQMENMKLQQQELTKELNRNLDIYKQLEFEKKFDKGLENISKLQDQLQELQKDLNSSDALQNKESLMQKQKDAMKNLDALKNELNALDEMNKVLTEPNVFKNPSENLETIKKKMSDAEKKIEAKDTKGAAEDDQSAENELAKMGETLEKEMEEGEEEQQGEDAAAIRLLLKSIVRTSFSQEGLMQKLQTTPSNSPAYPDIIRSQSVLRNEILQITDSINAISVRQPSVAVYTQKEVKQLLSYSREVVGSLLQMNNVVYQRSSIKNNQALSGQQYVMTSLNNLSLLLTESLDKMNQKKKGKGKGKKGKPNTSSPSENSKPSVKEMQDALNKQLQELKKALEGKTPQKLGEKGTPNASEAFAKAAVRQEMIRRMMQQQYKDLMSKNPKMAAELNRIMGEMEKTETDLVNKILSDQTLRRQENIQSRLLEAEKADLEREQEMRRESKEAMPINNVNSPLLDEFMKRKNNREEDVLRREIPSLKKYYKEKAKKFFE